VENMMILKGNRGKSKFLCELIGNNLCFEYYECTVNLGGYWMSNLNHSIDEFKDYIKACLYEEDKSGKENLYNYLIIYTNEKEEDLKDFISWLEDNERWFSCRNVIVTCK
jgi:hypothetical protein